MVYFYRVFVLINVLLGGKFVMKEVNFVFLFFILFFKEMEDICWFLLVERIFFNVSIFGFSYVDKFFW